MMASNETLETSALTTSRDLRQTMRMVVLKCQSVDGMHKELTSYVIAYNLVRLVMGEAASRQGVPPDRISFVDAMRRLPGRRPAGPRGQPGPPRPRRAPGEEASPKQFPAMQEPRGELRKGLDHAETFKLASWHSGMCPSSPERPRERGSVQAGNERCRPPFLFDPSVSPC
jgi:hypothetical protein